MNKGLSEELSEHLDKSDAYITELREEINTQKRLQSKEMDIVEARLAAYPELQKRVREQTLLALEMEGITFSTAAPTVSTSSRKIKRMHSFA